MWYTYQQTHGKIFTTSPIESSTATFNLDTVTGCTRNSKESDILFKSVQRTWKSFSLKQVPCALPKKTNSDFQGGEDERPKSLIIVELYMLQWSIGSDGLLNVDQVRVRERVFLSGEKSAFSCWTFVILGKSSEVRLLVSITCRNIR